MGRKAGVGGVWYLLLLAGVATATIGGGGAEVDPTAAAAAIAEPGTVGLHDDCISLCFQCEKFMTVEEFWKCIDPCVVKNHGTARAIRHDAARAAKPDAVGFPSCIGICYEKFDGKSEEGLEKCIVDCPELLNNAVIRAIRQVV